MTGTANFAAKMGEAKNKHSNALLSLRVAIEAKNQHGNVLLSLRGSFSPVAIEAENKLGV